MTGVCFCGRRGRGFYYRPPRAHPSDPQITIPACSMEHMRIARERKGNMKIMVDELKAVHAVSEEVGAYLERIGKTDLAAMTEAEWIGFIGHAYVCVSRKVADQWANDIPF